MTIILRLYGTTSQPDIVPLLRTGVERAFGTDGHLHLTGRLKKIIDRGDKRSARAKKTPKNEV